MKPNRYVDVEVQATLRRIWGDSMMGSHEVTTLDSGGKVYEVSEETESNRLKKYLSLVPSGRVTFNLTYSTDGRFIFPKSATLEDGYPVPMTTEITSWFVEVLHGIPE